MANDKPSSSPFWLRTIFPEPESIFSTTHKTLSEIKDECFIVLDANVLLLPYKLEDVSLPDVIDVYDSLCSKNRLIIPAQAAREFAKNRSQNVANLVKYMRDQSSLSFNILNKKIGALNNYPGYNELREQAEEINNKINFYSS